MSEAEEAAKRILNVDDGVTDEESHEYLDAVTVSRALLAANTIIRELADFVEGESYKEFYRKWAFCKGDRHVESEIARFASCASSAIRAFVADGVTPDTGKVREP